MSKSIRTENSKDVLVERLASLLAREQSAELRTPERRHLRRAANRTREALAVIKQREKREARGR